jgi:hypothetical protein
VVAYARANVLHPLQSESLLCLDELRCTSGAGIEGRKKPAILSRCNRDCINDLLFWNSASREAAPNFPEHITG